MDRSASGEGTCQMSSTLVVEDLTVDSSEVRVEGRSFHHLFRVRRLRVGDRVRLVDGRGLALWSIVERIDKRLAALEIREQAPSNEASIEVELYVATLRSARAVWLVEKATEIGVRAIHFFHCERAPRRYGRGTLDRLRRVAHQAVEQSQRSVVPVVDGVHDLDTVLERMSRRSRSCLLLDPESDGRLGRGDADSASVVVGPEGGLTTAEIEAFVTGGAQRVCLGSRILRVETAAVAAAALLTSSHPAASMCS